MKKLLTTTSSTHYFKDGLRIEGVPPDVSGDITGVRRDLTSVSGDLTGVRGDLTSVRGNLTLVYGDLTSISGDLTDIIGNLTGVRGDLDTCEITAEDRAKGIRIEELIEEDPRITEEDNQYKNNL